MRDSQRHTECGAKSLLADHCLHEAPPQPVAPARMKSKKRRQSHSAHLRLACGFRGSIPGGHNISLELTLGILEISTTVDAYQEFSLSSPRASGAVRPLLIPKQLNSIVSPHEARHFDDLPARSSLSIADRCCWRQKVCRFRPISKRMTSIGSKTSFEPTTSRRLSRGTARVLLLPISSSSLKKTQAGIFVSTDTWLAVTLYGRRSIPIRRC